MATFKSKKAAQAAARLYNADGGPGNWSVKRAGLFSWKLVKTTANPKIGSKLRDVRVKVGGKIVRAKAKRVNGKVKIYVTKAVARKVNPELKEYKVIFTKKGALSNVAHPVYATTAGGASRIAKSRKAEWFPDPRNWKVLSIGRVTR